LAETERFCNPKHERGIVPNSFPRSRFGLLFRKKWRRPTKHSRMTELAKSSRKICPDCGLTFPQNAPAGLCPACLLRAVMAAPEDPNADKTIEKSSTASGKDFQVGTDVPGNSVTAIYPSTILPDEYPEPGTKLRYFGDYELHEEIARGGMGVVYRARQVRLNRQVALKMIRAGKFSSGTEIQRLRVEAEAAAQLDHPAIVPVFEVGEYEGLHYFTMAFVDGETLSAKLASGPMPARAAAKLMQTVAEAVAYAHDKGVIHRDIKPGNILIDQSGQPRVSDFGLAKQVSSDNELTTTGQILGTPSYMPPEQALGKLDDVGKASDVYSLGAVLYATLTGRPPFQAATSIETLRLVVEELPLAPRLLNPSIPRDLETICLKCLEKSISRRYESALVVAQELSRFLRGDPILARPVGRIMKLARWYRRHWIASTAACSILLTIIGATTVLGVTARQLRTELTKTAAAESAALEANVEVQEKLWIAYLNGANARHRSRQAGQRFGALRAVKSALQIPVPKMRSLDELRTEATAALCLPDLEVDRRIPHTSRVGQFVLDNRLTMLGFDDGQSGQFVVREMATGTERMRMDYVESSFDYHSQTFSPDSQFLVYPKLVDGSNRLHIWSVANGKPMIDLGPEAINFEFRQDSQRVAVASANGKIRILDCNGFAEIQSLETGLHSPEVAWNPRFPQLVAADRDHWKVVDLENGAILSERQVNEGLYGWPSWHPSGRKFAMGTGNLKIGIWNSTSTELTVDPICGHRNGGVVVRFSPDGDRLVSNDWDQTIRMWDTRSGQQLLSVLANGVKLQFNDTGTHLAADCAGSEVRCFNYRSGQEFCTIPSHPGVDSDFHASHSVPCLNKTGTLMAVRVTGGVCLVDLIRDEVVCRLPISGNGPFRFISSSDTESLWTYGQSGLIEWPLKIDDAAETASIGPPERLLDLRQENKWASSADGSTILVPGMDHAVLWNQQTRKQEALLPGHWDVRTCVVTPDGKIGITGSHSDADTGAVVWDLEARRGIADLSIPQGNVFLSPDARWLITNGGVTRIWRVGEWSESRVLSQFRSQVCFSSDSQLVALSDDRSLVRLLIPETGREVAVLTAPETTQLLPLLFTRDGKRLITFGAETGALHIFDLQAIRKQLVELNLDWDYPPLPSAVEVTQSADSLKFTVDMGTYANLIQSREATDAARRLSREGKTKEYLDLLKQAVELDPRNALAQNNLAWTLAVGSQELRDTTTALVSAAAAVAEEPSQPTYRNTLGVVLYQAGQWDNAIVSLNESITMHGFADSHDAFFLAMAHWQRGEQVIAREWLQKAIEWMDKNAASDAELIEFRREAKKLILPPATTPTGEQ